MPTIAVTAGASLLGAYASDRASSRAADSQRDGQAAALAATERATQQARNDAIPLYGQAQQNALAGYQGAMDVFNQFAPFRERQFQQGNQNAQQALIAGLPQQQNAILGGPIDYSQMQVRNVSPPANSMFNQQLPDFNMISEKNTPLNPTINPIEHLIGSNSQAYNNSARDFNFMPWRDNASASTYKPWRQ